MINLLKKPIVELSLTDCYELAKLGYIITKDNESIQVRKSN